MPSTRGFEHINAHYSRDDLGEAILAGLHAAGQDPATLSPADLMAIDQFHIGGRDATLGLMELAGVPPGATVLDVGGGLGGAARTLASERACTVIVLDLTEMYCRVGALLTERTGLSDRVSFRHGNALDLPFDDASFDIVWTQHSSMNVADRERLYAEFHRVLRPGGTFALHEIMAGPNQPIHFPVPWARRPEISFLRTPVEVRDLLTRTGFRERGWVDLTAPSTIWWRERLAEAATQPGPPPLGLHILLGSDFPAMMQNMKRNLEEARLEVIQGVFERT
jgi:SAM-dependent methyltransferase